MKTMLTAFLLFYLTACEPLSGSGNLKVRWEIAGWNCYEVGVANVELTLFKDNKEVKKAVEECQHLKYTFSDIETGTYSVQIFGFNSVGEKTYEGSTSGVEVKDGSTSETTRIKLTQIKATVYISWKFSNGELCSSNHVNFIEVYIHDSKSNLIYETTNECELTTDPNKPYQGLKVSGLDADEYSIRLYGLNAEKSRLWRGDAKITLKHGEVKQIKIVLNPCSVSLICS